MLVDCKLKIIKTVLFVIFFANLFKLSAQEAKPDETWHYIEIDSTKQMWGDWAEPEWLRYFGLDAGDVNRDGNLDIISGRYIYHNPGGNMTDVWDRTTLDDNVDGILMFDVDGDPFADIIAMALPNVYWYEATNEKGTRYKRKLIGQIPATSHVNSQGFEKAQLVAGGLSEFVIAGNGDIYAVAVPETDPETTDWQVNLICKNTSDEGIGIGDIDGDGDLDIAAGRRADGEEEPTIMVWYENPGNIDTLWKAIVVGNSEHPIDRVEIADVNGDSKADIICTEERYPGKDPDANIWWFGRKSGDKWFRNNITTQFSTNNLDITDFDRDGDIDLLTAEHKGSALELQLWYNDGTGNFNKTILDTGKENHLGTRWVDLDGDGDLDIIGAGWDRHRFMHVWRNDALRPFKTGMSFKEHSWTPEGMADSGNFLRVGGKAGYENSRNHFPDKMVADGMIPVSFHLKLQGAVAAEIIVERVQSHKDTKNLTIQFNKGRPIHLPEPARVPEPAINYMFHSNIRAAVPLDDLVEGKNNTFRLRVDPEQSWDWPQNIIYGLTLRVYYTDDKKDTKLKIAGISNGQNLEPITELSLTGSGLNDIVKVDYIGFYEDVDSDGDGKYLQWQYNYHRAVLQNHIGSTNTPPFKLDWYTGWLPDQTKPMKIAARTTYVDGTIKIVEPTEGLRLERKYGVALIKPYGQPAFWSTRNKVYDEYVRFPFAPAETLSARLYWNSWSPCYSAGLTINGAKQAADTSAPCYDAFFHEEKVVDIDHLMQGTNTISTLKTPKHDGKMVHGMDVQWPGIMLKVKTRKSKNEEIMIAEGLYENRPHYVISTLSGTYYYDKAGGGFSRIIDIYGNDWVAYKTEPWNEYPASAAASYRGLPNLVFASEDSGAGHPGHDKCTSELIGENRIHTISNSGAWEWEWTFHTGYAELSILKTEKDIPYWFLYEGTPGGSYRPNVSIYGTNVSGPERKTPGFFENETVYGDFQWAYFNREDVANSFFVAQTKPDKKTDMMAYLGNTVKGVESDDGMAVFGFGRGKDTKALLTGPNSFIIGFWQPLETQQTNHQEITEHINNLIKTEQ